MNSITSQLPDELTQKIFFYSGLEIKDFLHATSINRISFKDRFENMAMLSPEALSSIICILLQDKPKPSLRERVVANMIWPVESLVYLFSGLSIRPSEEDTDPFEKILEKLPKSEYTTPLSLRVVSKEYYTQELDAKLYRVLKKFPCTECLDCDFRVQSFSQFNDFIKFLPTTCAKLKKLSLPFCSEWYSGGGGKHCFTPLKDLKHLEQIHITSSIDDALIQDLLDSCPTIHTLSFKVLRYIPSSGIRKVKEYSNLKELEFLQDRTNGENRSYANLRRDDNKDYTFTNLNVRFLQLEVLCIW